MRTRTDFVATMGAVAIAGSLAVLMVANQAGAQCSQGCTGNNFVCTGSTTGSCPGCSVSGPASCNTYGTTFFTGNATFGSTTGTQHITFNPTPCKQNTPCINGAPLQGSCDQYAWWFACNLEGFGGCQQCTAGTTLTVSSYSNCTVVPGCGGL